jgi:hypothetical protein
MRNGLLAFSPPDLKRSATERVAPFSAEFILLLIRWCDETLAEVETLAKLQTTSGSHPTADAVGRPQWSPTPTQADEYRLQRVSRPARLAAAPGLRAMLGQRSVKSAGSKRFRSRRVASFVDRSRVTVARWTIVAGADRRGLFPGATF